MIEFQCPSCHQTYRVKDDAVGRTGTCRTCSAKFVVPAVAVPQQAERPVETPCQPVASTDEASSDPFNFLRDTPQESTQSSSPVRPNSRSNKPTLTVITLCVLTLGIAIGTIWYFVNSRGRANVLITTQEPSSENAELDASETKAIGSRKSETTVKSSQRVGKSQTKNDKTKEAVHRAITDFATKSITTQATYEIDSFPERVTVTPKSGHVFLIVAVTFDNRGEAWKTYTASSFRIMNTDGRVDAQFVGIDQKIARPGVIDKSSGTSQTREKEIYAKWKVNLNSGESVFDAEWEIAPNHTFDEKLVFLVPAGTKGANFEIEKLPPTSGFTQGSADQNGKEIAVDKQQIVEYLNMTLRNQGDHVAELTVLSKKPLASGVEYRIGGIIGGKSTGTVKGTITVTRDGGSVQFKNDLTYVYK